jgi:hypothetical protein
LRQPALPAISLNDFPDVYLWFFFRHRPLISARSGFQGLYLQTMILKKFQGLYLQTLT